MKEAKLIVNKDFEIGEIDKRLYGSFVEHMRRVVYTGIYEPTHPLADKQGFRTDVIDLLKELNIPIIRYPGGNFVSGYDWTDGIGPVEKRPTRLELAWKVHETNEVGIDEFVDWTKKVNTELMAAVNLGTGSAKEAGNMVEYCNHSGGTYWSDLRKAFGHKQPHHIKLWCLGNEMDGPWQINHLTADDYGKKAKETAKIMKWMDPSIELVACGSSDPALASFPDWDRVVLENTYEDIEYLSIHRYYFYENNILDYLYSYIDMNNYIKSIVSTIDFVKAKKRTKKTVHISFDEYNVVNPVINQTIDTHAEWEKPKGESVAALIDLLALAGMICALMNNSDRVKIACQALLINEGGLINVQEGGSSIKQGTFLLFRELIKHGNGSALYTRIESAKAESNKYGDVPIVYGSAIYNQKDKKVTFFLLNYSMDDDVKVDINLQSFGKLLPIEHAILEGNDLFAGNTYDEPEKIILKKTSIDFSNDSNFHFILPKLSWNMIQFSHLN
ncbi:alpha-L-arabinofuranosidase C-terminal domain-containing protein [Heyndrickxia ginsengihumi]|uniref:alpha-N-arabinofuranosidase n=1 Tax=Heyndrickxia ginsengihumi TaxID=363870 RepID=UPI003D1B8E3D